MLIKRLSKGIFDVFLGNGFNNWTRVKATHFGVAWMAGNKVPHSILRAVTQTVHG